MNPFKKIFARSRAAVADAHSAIADLREQIAAIKARVVDIERAPQNIEAAMAAFDSWVDRIGTAALDDLRLELASEASWTGPRLPIAIVKHDGFAVRDSVYALEMLFGLVALTSREALRKIVMEQLADRMGDERGLSAEERATALASAHADLLAAELMEEGLIRAMDEAGSSVARRGDVPGAVLLAADSVLPS